MLAGVVLLVLMPSDDCAQALVYDTTAGDEVEDLLDLLAYAKHKMPQLQAVSCGAIASDYQRLRVEQVCLHLSQT